MSPHKQFSSKSNGSELELKPIFTEEWGMYNPSKGHYMSRNFPKMIVVKTVFNHLKTHRFDFALKTKHNIKFN